MSVLRFESEEALRFAVTSGLVPVDVLAGPARTWRDEAGAVIVVPRAPIPPEASRALAAAGVGRLPSTADSAAAREVASWPELVPLVSTKEDVDLEGAVLFWLPEDASLVGLAGELIRLGCDRLEHRRVEGGHLLRASAPPYYSVLRAGHAFVPEPPGQDKTWIAIGYSHPLARFLRTGELVLLEPAGWRSFPDAPFEDIYTLVDLSLPAAARQEHARAEPPRIPVPLRLAHAAAVDAPTFWVVRENAPNKVERLARSLPEEITRGLLFAALEGGAIVLRLRPGRVLPIEIEGEAYRAHPAIASLFLPVAANIEPPLRRDRLREMLTPDPDDVVWLRAGAGGSFTVEHTRDDAFEPLTSFVDYVIDRDRGRLIPWIRSTTFDFAVYVGEPLAAPAQEPAPPKKGGKEKAVAAPRETPAATAVAPPRAAPARADDIEPLRPARVDTSRVAEELAAVERQFFELEAPADAPERLALWARMGVLSTMLGRTHDAALSWTRILWEGSSESSTTWAEAENAAVRNVPSGSLLALVDPSRDHVRAIAARLVAGTDPEVVARVHDVTLWLDRHDGHLDVRSAWLARVAVSKLVGGDRLGLARVRDRLLSRIHAGLSLERDVPSFLRRAGRSRDAAQIELLVARVEALGNLVSTAKRRRSATEADPKLTEAYVRFVVAFGLARLGRVERARQVRDEAAQALPAADPIHAVLVRAYVARVGQALEGLPPETALPADVSASFTGLAKLERYKVDRVRQASKVLEPHERLDPIAAFQRGEADPRGPEFVALRGEGDPSAIERMVGEIIAKAAGADAETKARLYDGAMDFFPSLRHERAHEHLRVILGTVSDIEPARRVQVLEEALMLAGHFGEEPLAREIFTAIAPALARVGSESASAIAPALAGMLRTLRRFGLRAEAAQLLEALQQAAAGKGTASLVARLHTAGALSFLGQLDRARPVFDEALAFLRTLQDQNVPDRLKVTGALARALGTAPIDYALAGLAELEKGIAYVTDSFNTNTHVCLSVLDFSEALVLGYASDDLAIDPVARRFLDDDEYLVRRRISKDLK